MIRHEYRQNNRAEPYLLVGNRSAAKNKSKQRVDHSESNKENRAGISLGYDRSPREGQHWREEIVSFKGEIQGE